MDLLYDIYSFLRRPELVKNLLMRVAKKLGIPYVEGIIKTEETDEQKL